MVKEVPVVVEEEKDEKSTVSEISEEIMGDLVSSKTNDGLKSNKKSSAASDFKLDLNDDDDTSSSSSSTDTQILLLGSSRNKKIDEQQKEEEERQRNKEALAEKYEKGLLNETINEIIEIRDRKMAKLLAEEYQQQIEFNLGEGDDDENDEINQLEDDLAPNPFKIHIPSIDLSGDDDDDVMMNRTGKSSFKAETVKPIIYNIPITSEKITSLCNQAIEDYYWKRMDDLKSLLVTDYDVTNEDDLKGYFEETSVENKEAELNFKKMLLDLVGELLYDLYLERYDSPKAISLFLPGFRKTSKKTHFKSMFRGPNDLEVVKKLINEKAMQLLFKTTTTTTTTIQDTNTFNGEKKEGLLSSRSKWRSQKRMDLVDSLLDREMREQEQEWSNYEIEEYEAKLLVANTVFDMILKDTVQCFQLNLLKRNK